MLAYSVVDESTVVANPHGSVTTHTAIWVSWSQRNNKTMEQLK